MTDARAGRRRPGRLLVATTVVGGLALAGSLVGFGVDTRRALFAWLWAWAYWCGIAIAGLILLCIWHATRARWVVVFRRALEASVATMPLLALLFLPIPIGMSWLYPFADAAGVKERIALVLVHQGAYMNVALFVGRACAYFAIWIAVSEALLRWSRRQDGEGGLALTRRQRTLGAGVLPFAALAMSLAALDWLMAIEPRNKSSIFALYWWVGSLLGAISVVALWVTLARGDGRPGALANASHRASLGKFLLGFSVFWLYVAFCQWLLIWIADLPDEASWYVVRARGGWGWVAWAIVIGQWAVPFAVLLRRDVKEHPRSLAAVAIWVLSAHAVDTFWLVIPAVDPAAPYVHWADVTSFVAVGCLTAAFAWVRLRAAPIAVGDPYFDESVRYEGK